MTQITSAYVLGLSNSRLYTHIRQMLADARRFRVACITAGASIEAVAENLDPVGITAAYEYWPHQFDLLVTEADYRDLEWRHP